MHEFDIYIYTYIYRIVCLYNMYTLHYIYTYIWIVLVLLKVITPEYSTGCFSALAAS